MTPDEAIAHMHDKHGFNAEIMKHFDMETISFLHQKLHEGSLHHHSYATKQQDN